MSKLLATQIVVSVNAAFAAEAAAQTPAEKAMAPAGKMEHHKKEHHKAEKKENKKE